MTNYNFYVISENGIKDDLTITGAIAEYKSINTNKYKAIGVTKDDIFSIDLINNMGENNADKLSNDYLSINSFKNDNLIKINVISILKENFNL